MAWDTVKTLNNDVANHPLWKGSSWDQSFRNGQLTYTKWKFWMKGMRGMGDLTPDETRLVEIIEVQIAEFDNSWSFKP